jgi:hypothetical protein
MTTPQTYISSFDSKSLLITGSRIPGICNGDPTHIY